MIFRDIFMLASVKFRLRKRRTITSALVISLLFGAIVIVSLSSRTLFSSLGLISRGAFEGRTILQVASDSNTHTNPDAIRLALDLYEKSTDPDKAYPLIVEDGYGEPTTPYLDHSNSFAHEAVQTIRSSEAESFRDGLSRKIIAYNGEVVSDESIMSPKGGILRIESLDDTASTTPGTIVRVIDDEVLRPLLRHAPSGENIPIIVRVDEARRLLGLPALPTDSPAKDVYSQMEYVLNRAPGFVYDARVMDEKGTLVRSVSYEIVGILPSATSMIYKRSADRDLLESLLANLRANENYFSIVPKSGLKEPFSDLYELGLNSFFRETTYYVAFDEVSDAVKFRSDNCSDTSCSIQEFSTNQIEIYTLKQSIEKLLQAFIIFFGVVAGLTTIGVLRRVIDDERQATAIYRTVGATKWDVCRIYLLYSLMLSALSSVFAVTIGLIGSAVLDGVYSSELTYGARALYGLTSGPEVRLVGLDPLLLLIVGIILALGVICPLVMYRRIIGKSITEDISQTS